MSSAAISFTVDRTSIQAGECVTFSWSVHNVREVYFYHDGQPWQEGGVVGEGSRLECPSQTMSYYLRVVKQDGSVETRSIAIQVQSTVPQTEITFTVDRTTIHSGECVTFYWKVLGAREIYFYAQGQPWQEGGVVGEGSRLECPPRPTTYSLRVVKQDDSVETRQIPIDVQFTMPVQPPQIAHFAVVPSGQIYSGDCVDVQWNVQGAADRIRILRNGSPIWDGAPLQGQMQDCPPGPGSMTYTLEAIGPGGTNRMQQQIQVYERPTTQPPPPPPPPPQAADKPVIVSYTLTPGQIKLGETVTLSWQTGGGTNFVKITSGDDVVMRDAPLSGTTTVKPRLVGTVPYRVIAYNPEDDRVFEVREVIVVQ